MKTRIREVVKNEGGAALALTIILLLVGGLVIAPVLGHMGTGIKAGDVHEEKMGEVYAADAGVEDAMWRMMTELEVPELSKCAQGDFNPDPYTFEVDRWVVKVEMEFVSPDPDHANRGIFKITSRVFPLDVDFSQDPEPLTTIVSYVTATQEVVPPVDPDPDPHPDPDPDPDPDADPPTPPLNLSSLLDYALSSHGSIAIQPNSAVHGDIYIQDPSNLENKGVHDGLVKHAGQVQVEWPDAAPMSAFYFANVEHLAPHASGVIDINNTKNVGPLYRDGNLQVRNTGAAATLTLQGTVYITGDLEFEQPGGPRAYVIDLNGHTIFVEGRIDFPAHRVSIKGSGAIIAIGDVEFKPGVNSKDDDFVLVMSIQGQVWFLPIGDFSGAVAGESHIQLQPLNKITWTDWRGRIINVPQGEQPPDPGDGDADAGDGDGDEEEEDEEELEKEWQDWRVISYNINS